MVHLRKQAERTGRKATLKDPHRAGETTTLAGLINADLKQIVGHPAFVLVCAYVNGRHVVIPPVGNAAVIAVAFVVADPDHLANMRLVTIDATHLDHAAPRKKRFTRRVNFGQVKSRNQRQFQPPNSSSTAPQRWQ
jgi:hypothetical protein